MIRSIIDGCKELLELIFLWTFLHLSSLAILVVAVVYITHTQPKQQIPMIQPQEQISMVEPHITTFAEPIMKEVCTKIDGCRVIDNVCVDCLTVKN